MLFREAIDEINGLRHMADKLELRSGLARRVLYESRFMATAKEVDAELELVARMISFMGDTAKADALSETALKLGYVKDLRGTMLKLRAKRVLDDVEFFEIKVFAMTAEALRSLAADTGIVIVGIPDTRAVADLLDPDKTGIPHFSIYDSYSPKLAEIRRKIRKLKEKGADDEKTASLYDENQRVEQEVRMRLSGELAPFTDIMEEAMAAVARLDIVMAKAAQAREMVLCRPVISETDTHFKGMFNPALRDALREKGKDFQPVDISLAQAPTVITGANMGGKTVVLRTVALTQALFQFGFYVPAESADIAIADSIMTSIGDSQDEMSGLSSFAAEMMRIKTIMDAVASGANPLVLIDEPARTTNPAEGEAIVNALLDFLSVNHVRSLVTSHYGGIRADVMKLKVRGFTDDIPAGEVSVNNIQDHMDYSLTEDDGHAPREALRIARILGMDQALLDKAGEYLKN